MCSWYFQNLTTPFRDFQLDGGRRDIVEKVGETLCFNDITGTNTGVVGLIGKPQWKDTLFLWALVSD